MGSVTATGRDSRASTLVTACLEHSTNRPIYLNEWPLVASRLTSRSNSPDNRLAICALLDDLYPPWPAHRAVARIP